MSIYSGQYPPWLARPAMAVIAIGSFAVAVAFGWTAVQDYQLLRRGTRAVARIDSATKRTSGTGSRRKTTYNAIARVVLGDDPTSAEWLCCARTMTLEISAEQYTAHEARRAHRGKADEVVVEVACASADGPCQTIWALRNDWSNRLGIPFFLVIVAVVATVKFLAPKDFAATGAR